MYLTPKNEKNTGEPKIYFLQSYKNCSLNVHCYNVGCLLKCAIKWVQNKKPHFLYWSEVITVRENVKKAWIVRWGQTTFLNNQQSSDFFQEEKSVLLLAYLADIFFYTKFESTRMWQKSLLMGDKVYAFKQKLSV